MLEKQEGTQGERKGERKGGKKRGRKGGREGGWKEGRRLWEGERVEEKKKD